MAYYKSLSINGKSVKSLTLDGRAVKLQTVDHSAHALRFTMTGGTMGDIFVTFDMANTVSISVSAFDGKSEAPFAEGRFDQTPETGTKYFLSDVCNISNLTKGQYYEVTFDADPGVAFFSFHGSTSLDGTYDVSGNLSKSGFSHFSLMFAYDNTFTTAELYYDGELTERIFYSLFSNCESLRSFNGNLVRGLAPKYEGDQLYVSDYAFMDAFKNCTSLKSCNFFSLPDVAIDMAVGSSGFEGTFFGCTSLESVSMDFVSRTNLGEDFTTAESWSCSISSYVNCFYDCDMLHGLRPVLLAMKNDLNGNYSGMFYRAGLGSSENLFTGPIYICSGSHAEYVGYNFDISPADMFKDAKVGEIVYPAAFENDEAVASRFAAMKGSPEFGARVTEVTYRDVN